MIDPAHAFARATFDVLMVIHDRQLPAPLSLNWSEYTGQLGIQVPPGDFLRWLDALTNAERVTTVTDNRPHYKATGTLRGAPGVHVRITAVGQRLGVAA